MDLLRKTRNIQVLKLRNNLRLRDKKPKKTAQKLFGTLNFYAIHYFEKEINSLYSRL